MAIVGSLFLSDFSNLLTVLEVCLLGLVARGGYRMIPPTQIVDPIQLDKQAITSGGLKGSASDVHNGSASSELKGSIAHTNYGTNQGVNTSYSNQAMAV